MKAMPIYKFVLFFAQKSGLVFAAFLFVSYLSVPHVNAQAITSSGLGTTVTQNGTTYTITGGTRPSGGTNLFHSFGDFNVSTNNITSFLNETALPTNNIFARVTGETLPSIYGTIQTTGFQPGSSIRRARR